MEKKRKEAIRQNLASTTMKILKGKKRMMLRNEELPRLNTEVENPIFPKGVKFEPPLVLKGLHIADCLCGCFARRVELASYWII